MAADPQHPDSDALPRRGLMFVLSSPSGAGKTTIARKLLAAEDNLAMSVSVTTRPMRKGEREGVDYHFVDREAFAAMTRGDEFLEYAEVFGNGYGTPRSQIVSGLEQGRDFLFDIDWQGTQQLSQRMGADVVRVFLLPPSLDELHRRLTSRATDSADVIADRMARAQDEIRHYDAYEYVVINEDVERCFAEVRSILAAERQRRTRQTGLVEFVRGLTESG